MIYRKYINIVEAATKGCPIATQDIDTNLKNRQRAIDEYHYGPAATDRATDGNARATYDITQLPTQYDDNAVVDNPNSGGLVAGRPWNTP